MSEDKPGPLGTGSTVVEELPGETTDQVWLRTVYQGDHVPQFTWRAVLMGGALGMLLSISNLYTMLKVGWAFGVAITACVLSFVIWRLVRLVFPNVSEMSILENNCMQSTASAAGYSTGATVGLAFGALLLITGKHTPWTTVLPWTAVSALLGVFLAVPMKRQMINIEQLPFPSGIAAAETLKSLHAHSKEAIAQAYSLVAALVAGATVGFFVNGEFPWQIQNHLKVPELIKFEGTSFGVILKEMPGFGWAPSLLYIGAGMLIGMRVCLSMLIGSLALYFYFGPQVLNAHIIAQPGAVIKGWALWSGSAIMVTSGLTTFALEWKTILRSLNIVKVKRAGSDKVEVDPLAEIEVPLKWLVMGIVPLAIASVTLQYLAFSISPVVGITTVCLSFVLGLIACRATGETDVTPMSAMCKITQLTVAVMAPKNIVTNLMAASVTANIASSSADLLTDLKSGYLLGANARKQFLAQLSGVFFGLAAVVPAWYLMVPNKERLEAFEPPTVNVWKSVAIALSQGIDTIPDSARWGMVVAGLLGIALALLDKLISKKYKPYVPSAMGLGLSWVMPFSNAFGFFLGALLASIWRLVEKKSAELYVVPMASGAVAGESLMCAILAIMQAAAALTNHL